jgi:hypothetical protein
MAAYTARADEAIANALADKNYSPDTVFVLAAIDERLDDGNIARDEEEDKKNTQVVTLDMIKWVARMFDCESNATVADKEAALKVVVSAMEHSRFEPHLLTEHIINFVATTELEPRTTPCAVFQFAENASQNTKAEQCFDEKGFQDKIWSTIASKITKTRDDGKLEVTAHPRVVANMINTLVFLPHTELMRATTPTSKAALKAIVHVMLDRWAVLDLQAAGIRFFGTLLQNKYKDRARYNEWVKELKDSLVTDVVESVKQRYIQDSWRHKTPHPIMHRFCEIILATIKK